MRKSGLIAGGAIVAVVAIGVTAGSAIKHRQKSVPVIPAAAVSSIFEGPEITLAGPLQAQTTDQVEVPVAGILEAWFVDVGAEVYEDQLVGRVRNADLDTALQNAQEAVDRAEVRIAQLDAQALSAQLEESRTAADQIRARNELDRIEKVYQRYQNLFEVGALPRLTFEKTEADYKSAKLEAENRDASAKDAQKKAASLDRDSADAQRALADRTSALQKAKDAVAGCDLHSPADGVVLTRTVHQGDKVEENDSLMTVATSLTQLAVSLTPNPPALARIRAGQHAFVRLTDVEFSGEVHELRGADVVVWFTAPEPVTKLGTAAQVRIVF